MSLHSENTISSEFPAGRKHQHHKNNVWKAMYSHIIFQVPHLVGGVTEVTSHGCPVISPVPCWVRTDGTQPKWRQMKGINLSHVRWQGLGRSQAGSNVAGAASNTCAYYSVFQRGACVMTHMADMSDLVPFGKKPAELWPNPHKSRVTTWNHSHRF